MAQTKVAESRGTNHRIGCTIHVQDREWRLDAPAIITGTVRSLIEGPVEISAVPILYLSSRAPLDEGDKYWAPVDLLRDGPLTSEGHPVGKNSKAVGIRPVPIKLSFKTKDDSVDFRLDAGHVRWEKEISSIWPSRDLFAVVQPGSYNLRLVLETGDGDSACSSATVVIISSKTHPSKP